MKHSTLLPAAFVLLAASPTTALPSLAADREPAAHRHSPTPTVSAQVPRQAQNDDLDQALSEFKSAAQRLGKSLADAASENTVETRKKVMNAMKGAVQELTHTMDRASERFESAKAPGSGKESKGSSQE